MLGNTRVLIQKLLSWFQKFKKIRQARNIFGLKTSVTIATVVGRPVEVLDTWVLTQHGCWFSSVQLDTWVDPQPGSPAHELSPRQLRNPGFVLKK